MRQQPKGGLTNRKIKPMPFVVGEYLVAKQITAKGNARQRRQRKGRGKNAVFLVRIGHCLAVALGYHPDSYPSSSKDRLSFPRLDFFEAHFLGDVVKFVAGDVFQLFAA